MHALLGFNRASRVSLDLLEESSNLWMEALIDSIPPFVIRVIPIVNHANKYYICITVVSATCMYFRYVRFRNLKYIHVICVFNTQATSYVSDMNNPSLASEYAVLARPRCRLDRWWPISSDFVLTSSILSSLSNVLQLK